MSTRPISISLYEYTLDADHKHMNHGIHKKRNHTTAGYTKCRVGSWGEKQSKFSTLASGDVVTTAKLSMANKRSIWGSLRARSIVINAIGLKMFWFDLIVWNGISRRRWLNLKGIKWHQQGLVNLHVTLQVCNQTGKRKLCVDVGILKIWTNKTWYNSRVPVQCICKQRTITMQRVFGKGSQHPWIDWSLWRHVNTSEVWTAD